MIDAKTPQGEAAAMHRWALQEQVWTKLLDEAGFTRITTETLPAADGPRTANTPIVGAAHRS